jgi:hypothetical protein
MQDMNVCLTCLQAFEENSEVSGLYSARSVLHYEARDSVNTQSNACPSRLLDVLYRYIRH